MAEQDPWELEAQRMADDNAMQDTAQMKAAAASAPAGLSQQGAYTVNKAAPGSATQITELPSKQPTHTVISGDAGGLSASQGPDPWEAEAHAMRFQEAAARPGADLLPLLKQRDALGIPTPPAGQAPPPPTFDHGQTAFQKFQAGTQPNEWMDESNYVGQRWRDVYGQAAMASAGPALAAWAKAKGLDPNNPETAAQFVRSTLPDEMVQKTDARFAAEHKYLDAVKARDQLAAAIAESFKAQHPAQAGDDMAIYRAVHQQIEQFGGPDTTKLPPFIIHDGKVQPAGVSTARGAMDAFLKGTGDLVYKPAEYLEGMGQAVTDRFGSKRMGAQAGPGVFEGMRQRTESADNNWQQLLPASDVALNDQGWRGKLQRSVEGVSGAAPQIIVAAATGGSSAGLTRLGAGLSLGANATRTINTALMFTQMAGASYEDIYKNAIDAGMAKKDASAAAAIGGTIDGAVNAYAMRYGVLGSMQKASMRGYLGSIIKSAIAQGGVSAGQDLLNQATNYLATGKDPSFERLMDAAIAGFATGGFFAAANPAGVKAAYRDFTGASDPTARAEAAEKAAGHYGGGAGGMDDAGARAWLGLDPKAPLTKLDVLNAWRDKVQETHPDHGGTVGDFDKTLAARAVLLQGLGKPGSGKRPPPPPQQPAPAPEPTASTPEAPASPPPAEGQASTSAAPVPGKGEEPAPAPGPGHIDPTAEPSATELLRSMNGQQDTPEALREHLGDLKDLHTPYDGPPAEEVVERTGLVNALQAKGVKTLSGKWSGGQRVPLESAPLDKLREAHDQVYAQPYEAQPPRTLDKTEEMYAKSKAGMNVGPDGSAGERRFEKPEPSPAAKQEPVPAEVKEAAKGHPAEMTPQELGEWYARTFNDEGGKDAITMMAEHGMNAGGKYVLADVVPSKVKPPVATRDDTDPAKVASIKKLSPEGKAKLPPAILAGTDALHVADGNHRLTAAAESGDEHVLAYVPDHWIGTDGIQRATGNKNGNKRAPKSAAEPPPPEHAAPAPSTTKEAEKPSAEPPAAGKHEPPAEGKTDAQILDDQKRLVSLRGRLQRGELAGDEKTAAEKEVDHLAATIQQDLMDFGDRHGEDAGEDLIEKVQGVQEERPVEKPAAKDETPAHVNDKEPGQRHERGEGQRGGRDEQAHDQADGGKREQGREEGGGREGQQRPPEDGQGRIARALWPEAEDDVALAERHERAARTLQKEQPGLSDEHALEITLDAIDAARRSFQSKGDLELAETAAIDSVWKHKGYNRDEIPREFLDQVVREASGGKALTDDNPTLKLLLGHPGPWDFESTFPGFTKEAIREGLAWQAISSHGEDDREDEAHITSQIRGIHDVLGEDVRSIRKGAIDALQVLGNGKDPRSGKKLSIKQREALNKQVRGAEGSVSDLLDEYERHFGEKARQAFEQHLKQELDQPAAAAEPPTGPAPELPALPPAPGKPKGGKGLMKPGTRVWYDHGTGRGQPDMAGTIVGKAKDQGYVVVKFDPESRAFPGQEVELHRSRLTTEPPEGATTPTTGATNGQPPELLPRPGEEPAAGGTDRGSGQSDVAAGVPEAAPAPAADGATGQRGEGRGGELPGPLQPDGGSGGKPRRGRRGGGRPVPESGTSAEAGPSRPGAGPADSGRELPSPDAGGTDAKAAPANTGNFRITDPDAIEAGGARTKFKNNIAAIELLRKIQGEGRARATPEEQAVLAKYSGWGQFPQVFNEYGEHAGEDARKWSDERKLLRDLIPDEAEWERAKRSTLNAHYTSPRMVQAVYSALQRLGFGGGRVLEPSMGAGIFFGLMPPDMAARSRLTGVELDPTTGAIAKLLYPDANVQVKGFEEVKVPDGFFDAAVGNVPFGDFRVHDRDYNKYVAPIHDYFFLKSLDKLRPGGVLAFITSTGTMDKATGERIRAALAERGDLIAAARLPEGAFQKSAGTAVVTDLLVFRRRAAGEAPAGEPFAELKTLPDPDGGAEIPVNEYFEKHPEHILGTLDRKSRLYGRGDMHVSATPDFEDRLRAWIDALPKDVYADKPKGEAAPRKPKSIDAGGMKEGAYKTEGGKVYRNKGGELVDAGLPAKTQKIIADTLKVRDALRDVINGQLEGLDDAELEKRRAKLLKEYKGFTDKHGPLHKRANLAAFADDPDAPLVQALEKSYDPKTGAVERADVFVKNTIRSAEKPGKTDNVGSALGIVLNELGRVDLPRIAALTGKDEAAAGKELVGKGLAFEDPAGGWKSAEQYLSGNVRKRLAEARDAAAADPRFEPNVTALEKVIPADIDYDQIGVRLGSAWVPPSDIKQFVAETFGGIAEHFDVKYLERNGTWLSDYTSAGRNRWKGSPQDTQLFGTERAGFMDVLEAALNNKQIRITDPDPEDRDKRIFNAKETEAANAKVKELQEAFRNWIWEDDARRARLHRFYNDTFNNIAPVHYDGSHLTFPGMNPGLTLRKHQANAVWRTIVTGTGLYGHEVGTGKTYTMAAAAMELRRLGLARKPAIVGPKKNQATIIKQARELYPAARIHVVEDFDAKGRKNAVARIATGDYDLVVMTHDHLNMLPMSSEVQADFIRKELAELEAVKTAVDADAPAKGGKKSENRLVKQLEKMKAALETKLKEALDSKKDDAVTFEQTGIDQLFVDEAHAYKSLPVYTKHQRVKGIPQSRSDRATQMWMRAQWLQELQGGRGVVFATGTPVTNTMAEVYTMQRFLQMKDLEERGVSAFDAWASTFGTLNTRTEYSVSGDYQPVTRFNAFINLPELQQITRQAIDVQRAKDLPNFKRPKRQDHVVPVPMTPEQLAFMGTIKQRAVEAKKKRPGEPGDNMLSISTDARKSAVDHRLIDPSADMTGGKVDAIASNVLRILKENPGTTQMVFSDFGLHPSEKNKFTFFGALHDALVAGGIPADRIVNFTTITEAQEKKAADRLNAGDAIIGLASSTAGGTGINAQQHLIALHHADVPWIPAFVEQRDGRGWRQGNKNPAVHIYRYVTEGSFDTFMWQTVDAKTRFIQQFLDGNNVARGVTEEDGEELTPAQIMAISSGDPLLLDRINLEAEVAELEKAQQRHQRQDLKLRDTVADLRKKLDASGGKEKDIRAALAAAVAVREDDFEMELGGKKFTKRDEADAELNRALQQLAPTSQERAKYHPIGSYKGFPLEMSHTYSGGSVKLTVGGLPVFPGPSVASIEHYGRPSYWEGRLGEVLNNRKAWSADLAKLEKQTGRAFPHVQVLKEKKAKLDEIQNKLAAKAQGPGQPTAAGVVKPADQVDAEGPYGGGGRSGAASIAMQPHTAPSRLSSKTAPGPAAAARGIKDLRPIAMPELIKLATALMKGGKPVMKRLPKALGRFSVDKAGDPHIRIDPRRVKGPFEMAAVLAHEVGHLEDWLPTHDLARGNIVGRLNKLHRFTAQRFGTMSVTNKALKKELVGLSEWWNPYDKLKATPGYIAYRDSPAELYADALSVLLNAPGEVEARAPEYFKALGELMDARPEFRDAFFDLQDLLAGTPEKIAEARRLDVREAYRKAEDVMKARAEERVNASKARPLTAVRQLFMDALDPALKLQREAEKKLGRQLPEAENAKWAYAELSYADNAAHLWLKELDDTIHTQMDKLGLTPEDMGEYLQMTRTETERAEMANPQGHTPETARQMKEDLAKRLGPDKYGELERLAKAFHDHVFTVVEDARDVGYYNAKQFKETLEPNRYKYATFAVVKYLEDTIGAGIMQQVGTFGDVANPYTATVMKTVSLLRAIQRQKAVTPFVNMMKHHFAGDIEKVPARVHEGGRRSEPKTPVGKGLLQVFENGHPEWYAVDPYLSRMYQNHDIGTLNAIGKFLTRLTYGTLHPLYVGFNVGWHLRLIPRDFLRAYRNSSFKGNPTTVREILTAYWRALPHAWNRVRGNDDPLIEQMLRDKALDVPWKDYDFNGEHEAYERLLDRYGLGQPDKKPSAVMQTAAQILRGIEGAGSLMVSVPKIAGWQVLQSRKIEGAERAYRVRNFFGHPDRRRRGLGTNLSNGVAMYSNILMQFYRADYEAGVQDPTTRSGWWIRTLLTTLLPKALLAAGAAGLLGAWLKSMLDAIPEADKAKYIIIPLWMSSSDDGKTRKPVYARIPQDPSGTLLGGMLWKMLHTEEHESLMSKVQQAIDVPYADGPHLNPYIQSALNWAAVLRGQNPYDSYRQRQIIPDNDFKAGGWYRYKDMIQWQLNQLGVLSTLAHAAIGKPGEKETTVESVLGSIPGGFILSSDRGITEKEELAAALDDAEKARFRLSLGDDVEAAVRERYRLTLIKAHDDSDADRGRRARLNAWYSGVYLPLTKAIKDAEARKDTASAEQLRARLSASAKQLQ